MTKTILPNDIRNGKSSLKVGSPKLSKMKTKKSPKDKDGDSADELKIEPDYYNLYIDKVNVIENIAKTKTIFSKEYIAHMKAEPRPGDKKVGNR